MSYTNHMLLVGNTDGNASAFDEVWNIQLMYYAVGHRDRTGKLTFPCTGLFKLGQYTFAR